MHYLDKYLLCTYMNQTSAMNDGSDLSLHRSRFKWPPSTVKHRASRRPLHCEVHLELLSKYQENQTVKEVTGGWLELPLRNDTIFSVSVDLVEAIVEFPGDQHVQTLMRKRVFLALTKPAKLTLSAIDYRRSRHSIWPDMRAF